MIKEIYKQALKMIEEGQSLQIKTTFSNESGSLDELSRNIEIIQSGDYENFTVVKPQLIQQDNLFTTIEPVFPRERLIILGAGHIAMPLCEFSAKCGFNVTVVDDRQAFANTERFPMASEVICDSFEHAIESLKITSYDYVVVITRGHKHDAKCLRTLFKGVQSAYLGMIGSRRRVRGLLEMLKEEGYEQSRLDAICSPIGLNIGSVTPEEIAISILSEVISYKRLPANNQVERYINGSDLEYDMIEYLASNNNPQAVVTVIETKGSTPRGVGAKMSVDTHGNVTGSIGGGCSEGAIIRDAIDIIGTHQYQIAFIDMTGDVAESEGMVCGGTMKVLIEDGA